MCCPCIDFLRMFFFTFTFYLTHFLVQVLKLFIGVVYVVYFVYFDRKTCAPYTICWLCILTKKTCAPSVVYSLKYMESP